MAAVACTTGLGLGRIQPVEQIVGLTIVTRDATVLKTGASWRLGRGGVAHGMPDPGGIFLGSQGRFGVITEVVLTLAPAPFLAARFWDRPWRSSDELATHLRRARQSMDQGTVDSLRLETVCAGRAQPNATEWFVRCWAPESAEAADQRCAALAQSLDARDPRAWIESAAGRRGATVQKVNGTTVELQAPQDLLKDLQAGDQVKASVQKQADGMMHKSHPSTDMKDEKELQKGMLPKN
jgi:FAD/FMN-containing dehydrogenase